MTLPTRRTTLSGAKLRMMPPMVKMKLANRMQTLRPSQPFKEPPARAEKAAAQTVLDTSSSCHRALRFISFFRSSMAPETTPVSYPKRNPPGQRTAPTYRRSMAWRRFGPGIPTSGGWRPDEALFSIIPCFLFFPTQCRSNAQISAVLRDSPKCKLVSWKRGVGRKVEKTCVRLKIPQEDRQVCTLIQIIQDLLFLAHTDNAAELFEGKSVHAPLMLVLSSYSSSKGVQQVGWSLLCRLIVICPDTLEQLTRPLHAAKEWEVLGVHQQILKVFSQYSSDCRVTMVGLRVLALLLRSDMILRLVLEEDEEDVFVLVVQAMKMFPSEEVQLQGCAALQLLLEGVSDEHLVEFVENQDHVVVLAALQRFSDSPELLLQAMRVLLPLARIGSNVEMLMSGGSRCYSLVIAAMDAFPEEEGLQETACCLFRSFTSESYYNILVLNGVQRIVVRACQRFPDNAKLQAAALSCLADLTATIVQNKAVAEQGLEEGEAEENRGREEVEDMGLLSTELLVAMLLHSSSPRVFQAATSAISTLLTHNSKVRSLLLSSGLHVNLVEMMKSHSNSAEVSISACNLLKLLFQGRTASLDELTMAMTQILISMKVHNFQPEVQLEALQASLVFLCPDRSLREHGVSVADPDMADVSLKVLKNQCVVEGAHTLYLEVLNRFISSELIQRSGLKVLSSLADCSGAVDLLCQQGAIDTIHFWGLTLLSFLVSKKKLSRMIVPVLASVVVASLLQYRDDSEMHLKCVQVALRMLDACSGAAAELQREGFDRQIFQHLREEPPDHCNTALRKSVCLALSKMWCDYQLHCSLLEKACEDGDATLAECLIELGADINRKTKTECVSVGGLWSWWSCCSARGPRAAPAPGPGCECEAGRGSHRHPAAGPLGLDLNNNALCLGGFRLGRLDAAWLSPLLGERGRTHSLRYRDSRQLCAFITSGSPGDPCLTSGYFSDESDDSNFSFFSTDDSLFLNDDMESDGSDSLSGVLSPKPLNNSTEELRGGSFKRKQGRRRHASAESGQTENESEHGHRRYGRAGSSHKERERVRLLDLSGNELASLSCLMDDDIANQLQSLPEELLSLHSLSTFNVSRNCVGPLLTFDPAVSCPSLRQLNLSFNKISTFPQELGRAVGQLEELFMEGNSISELSVPLCLPEIKLLDVSKNSVENIAPDFLTGCPKLETFSASMNRICEYRLLHSG
ncbi:hypothetical protein F7725_023287 [Dissostichus mawsoni]|uniref:Uncharacterized protein n=1 Tax=Dissostichus mawsoni TaxID=36200 RepID=A0A7J5Z094_DISMA|nr:hypothetical protein F7725_023287 [Dissostichus mawsoni]